MFELKKIVSSLLMSLPALLMIGLLGLLVLWFTRRHGFASLLISVSLVGIFLVSFQPVSTLLLTPMERQYKAFLPGEEPIDYIMVLGNGHVVDEEIPATSELSRAALMRLAEGIRIYRMYPDSKLILSGYNGGSEISHARMLAKVALALGVDKSAILLHETARDTWEEAFQAAAVVGDKKLVVVTSASHMPRALTEFDKAGLNPIPAPTNYLAHQGIKQPWEKYAPKARYLEQTERYWYETLGQWWHQLRGQMTEVTQANPYQNPESISAPLTP